MNENEVSDIIYLTAWSSVPTPILYCWATWRCGRGDQRIPYPVAVLPSLYICSASFSEYVFDELFTFFCWWNHIDILKNLKHKSDEQKNCESTHSKHSRTLFMKITDQSWIKNFWIKFVDQHWASSKLVFSLESSMPHVWAIRWLRGAIYEWGQWQKQASSAWIGGDFLENKI